MSWGMPGAYGGFPPYLDAPGWGCDPFPDGNTLGPIIAPAVPWITQYKLLQSAKPSYRGGLADVDYLLEPDAIQRGCRKYWHIECYAIEKQMLREEAEETFSGTTTMTQIGGMAGAKPSSQLKLLVEWVCARQERRFFIADIGTGLDLQVGPTTRPRAMILSPDPEQIPDTFPPGFDLQNHVTATVVTARATPISAGYTPWNGRYTQSLLIPSGSEETLYHQIPRLAREVMLYETDLTSGGGLSGTPSTWGYAFDQVTPGGPYIPLGVGGEFPRVSGYNIPQNGAKFISVQPPTGGPPTDRLVTLVYMLSL